MSSQRGNIKKKAPKHQNTFTFRHNPNSKKTQRILAMPIQGLCDKCHKQIEWRKKYRKYKPLTQPATCVSCHQKNVTAAYHIACASCAQAKGACAKCMTPLDQEDETSTQEQGGDSDASSDGEQDEQSDPSDEEAQDD